MKTSWLLAGQKESGAFKANYRDMIKDDKFPDSIRGISMMPGLVKAGKTRLIFSMNKYGDVSLNSTFPSNYSNIDIINVGVAFVDKVTELYNADAKSLCNELFRKFQNPILEESKDASLNRLSLLFKNVSDYVRSFEKKEGG